MRLLESDSQSPGRLAIATVLLLVLPVAFFFGCAGGGTDSEAIRVLVAASAGEATQRAADIFVNRYPKANRPRIIIVTGASSSLAQQILAGADADVFISANQAWSQAVSSKDTRTERLLTNRLVLATPEDSDVKLKTIEDLKLEQVKTIAVAGQSVPVGAYADQVIGSLSETVESTIRAKLAFAKDSSALIAWLETNQVDAAFIYKSDLQRAKKLKAIAQIDESLHDPIEYPIVTFNAHGKTNQDLRDQFVDWLKSDEARKIYRDSGFEIPESVPESQSID